MSYFSIHHQRDKKYIKFLVVDTLIMCTVGWMLGVIVNDPASLCKRVARATGCFSEDESVKLYFNSLVLEDFLQAVYTYIL